MTPYEALRGISFMEPIPFLLSDIFTCLDIHDIWAQTPLGHAPLRLALMQQSSFSPPDVNFFLRNFLFILSNLARMPINFCKKYNYVHTVFPTPVKASQIYESLQNLNGLYDFHARTHENDYNTHDTINIRHLFLNCRNWCDGCLNKNVKKWRH